MGNGDLNGKGSGGKLQTAVSPEPCLGNQASRYVPQNDNHSNKRRSQLLNGRWFRRRFDEPEVESLYQKYTYRSRRGSLSIAALLGVTIGLSSLVSSALLYSSSLLPCLIIMGIFVILDCIIFGVLRAGIFPEKLTAVMPFVLWIIMSAQLYCDVILGSLPVSPSSGAAWQACIIFSAFIILALKLRWCLCLAILSVISHSVIVVIVPVVKDYAEIISFGHAIGANLVFYFCVVLLGVVVFYIIDKGYRNDFLGIKDSLAVNMQIEESAKEQEGLLLSVLPRHVAMEMIKDLGGQLGGQFRKVYMNRHENVSILFADIVGFTAMSSSVTPGELVKILNDLFATFDKLANTYHQLRIKILGDCYYCVCGCPDPRPDHAVLAIHMGLSMVDAISEVREKTRSGVNMRVGVHTGAILGGVLGQNRWQYDVVGKEVVVANQMESSGIAGRVHISSVTATFLSGEFELEPGEGELRDDGIRSAGLKTYLVKSVLKPHPKGTEDVGKPSHTEESTELRMTTSTIDQLETALIEREKTVSHLGKRVNLVTQHFRSVEVEKNFARTREYFGAVTLVMSAVVLCFYYVAQILVLPITATSLIVFFVGVTILTSQSVILFSNSFPLIYPGFIVKFAAWLSGTRWAVSLYVALATAVSGLLGVSGILTCENGYTFNWTNSIQPPWDPQSPYCFNVPYFSHLLVLVECCVILQVQIGYLVQGVLNIGMTIIYCILNLWVREDIFYARDRAFNSTRDLAVMVPSTHIATSITLIGVAVILTLYARNVERIARRLFFYRLQMDEVQGQIDVLRRKNEALVYNILPPHVAKHFIGSRRNDEDLYSQYYEEAGVMFSSCPNFNTHYTEDAVNNNGLEWIRFLNEVLSDYDDLLNEARFKNVIKIKTVGSTYMAASGINLESPIPRDATIKQRWQHLSDLVEFCFALKETLDRINAQSFNTFMLRIGLKHGPVLAGVIGAGKPHYDIWSNTVNVASRMDSTGKLGNIQVTQDTMEILEEFGYNFEKRGIVKVKGKGELLTYFLLGKDDEANLPNQVSPF